MSATEVKLFGKWNLSCTAFYCVDMLVERVYPRCPKLETQGQECNSIKSRDTAPQMIPIAAEYCLDPYSSLHALNRRTYEDVMLSDLSLVDYIAVKGTAQLFLPHTQGRYQMRRFRKALCPIVERLVCSMMMHGRNNGKKLMAVRIVKHAFEIIHLLTDKNPIQVFVDAVKNGGPREDSTRVGSAGVVRRQAVDVSPLRRVNQAIYLICTGARNSAFRNIKSISECLADEIMNCAKESSNSYAIKILVLSCLKLSISFWRTFKMSSVMFPRGTRKAQDSCFRWDQCAWN